MKRLSFVVALIFALILSQFNTFAASKPTPNPDYRPMMLWYCNTHEGLNIQKSYTIYKKTETTNFSYQITCKIPNYVCLVQSINVNPNSKYILSGWIKTENIKGGSVWISNEMDEKEDINKQTVNGTESWSFLKYEFETTEMQRWVSLCLYYGDQDHLTTGTAYYSGLIIQRLGSVDNSEDNDDANTTE